MSNLKDELIAQWQGEVNVEGTDIVPGPLLGAIAHCESSYGIHKFAGRYEPAFGPGGMYFKFNEELKRLYSIYGHFVSMSFGAWQILYVSAQELGFADHPCLLMFDEVCIEWAVKYINIRAIKRGAVTPEQVFDAYNSGNHRDRNIPHAYIAKASKFYRENINRYDEVG